MSDTNKKGSSKFQFVSEGNDDVEKEISLTAEKKESSDAEKKKREDVNLQTLLHQSGEETDTQIFNTREMAIIRENMIDEKDELKKSRKFYFGFRLRVGLFLCMIILLFSIGTVFIYQALNSMDKKKVQYIENADVQYQVCMLSSDSFSDNCGYSSYQYPTDTVSRIRIDYDYNNVLLDTIDIDSSLNLTYYIEIVNRIVDKFDSSKILYENEDLIIDKTPIEFIGTKANVNTDFSIDFKKYNDFFLDYQKKYSEDVLSQIELQVFVDDGVDSHSVGVMRVPLGVDTLKVEKDFVKNDSHDIEVMVKEWSNHNTLYVVIGSCLIFLSLVIMVYFTRFVLTVLDRRSKYEKKLMEILREYDRFIVIARDGYETDIVKQVIKVPNFDELLDARDILDKPIIYSRVNNVKSEFIVEDDEKIYKYVLKEADLEG